MYCWKKVSLKLLLALTIAASSSNVLSADKLDIKIHYLVRDEEPVIPLSLLDTPVEDAGLKGVQLGVNDSQTTGSFLNHFYSLEETRVAEDADIKNTFAELRAAGDVFFVADLHADDLRALQEVSAGSLVFNIRAKDNILRNEQCHSSLFHIAPSRAMLADALAQYFAWKKWQDLVLVTGRHSQDEAFSLSLQRAAKRFGLNWVQEKQWTAVPGARRSDSGHHSLQQQIPQFSQFKNHDVLLVADEADEFGEYLTYSTSLPRLVAGTQGLIATSWHRSQEQWGATQIQRRFEKLGNRTMTERDYAGWAAVRTIAEAVTVTNSNEVGTIREFILSDAFKLAAFKGVPLTFRDWNGQLRQPILLSGPRMLISVSPQRGFLHQRSELDTLGFDKPESSCKQFSG